MDPIKDAFTKVKEDFLIFKNELNDIKRELNEIQISILNLTKLLGNSNLPNQSNNPTKSNLPKIPPSTHSSFNSTDSTDNSTDNLTSTQKYQFKPLKELKTNISIRNRGVSTDRQTIRQTDNHIEFTPEIPEKPLITPTLILSQLDTLKKELRFKIKKLTKQELLVFSSIYQFEDQGEEVNYAMLSEKLNLSESSIRDYTQRIINKGIPLLKEKVNNKQIILHISQDFKKLATLDTLLNLRNL